jgi:hypothetical protein
MPNGRGDERSLLRQLVFGILLIMAVGAAAFPLNRCSEIGSIRERDYPIPDTKCRSEEQCAEKAVEIQAREAVTADAALEVMFAQLALGIVGVLGVGCTVFYAHRAWRAAWKQANTIQEDFVAEHRPWIPDRIEPIGPMTWDATHLHAWVRFELVNTGNSPAHRVMPFTALRPLEGSGWGSDPAVNPLLGRNSQQAIGPTIFPGDKPQFFNVGASLARADLEPFRDGQGRPFVSLVLILSIDYLGLNGQLHKTLVFYDVLQPIDEKMPVDRIVDLSKSPIPYRLRRSLFQPVLVS